MRSAPIPIPAIPFISFNFVQHRMYPVRNRVIRRLSNLMRAIPISLQCQFNRPQ